MAIYPLSYQIYTPNQSVEVGVTVGTGLLYTTKEAIPAIAKYPGKVVYDKDTDILYVVNSSLAFVQLPLTGAQLVSVLEALTGPNRLNSTKVKFENSDVSTELTSLGANKANLSNVLTKDNTEVFIPDGDYEPATKKYVDNSVSNAGGGDMLKNVYDTDNDGVVDKATGLRNGLAVVTWANIQTMFDNVATELASKALASALTAHINKTIDAHDSANIEHTGTFNSDKVVQWILDYLQEYVNSLRTSCDRNEDDVQLLNVLLHDTIDALPNITRVSASRAKINGQAYSEEVYNEGNEDVIIDFDLGNVHRVQVISAVLSVSTSNSVNGASYVIIFYAAVDTVISFSAEFIDLDPITLYEGEEIIVAGMRSNNHFLMKSSDRFNSSSYNAPILTSISIDSGAETCTSQSVIISLVRGGGNTPTGYKISERSDFLDVPSWSAYVSDSISYSLSSGDGSKTVYVKLKDANNAESSVKSDSITMVSIAPVIDAITLKDVTSGSTVTTDSLTIKIEIELSTSGILMQTRVSESPTFADDPAWTSWNGTSDLDYTITNSDPNEDKTVYVQVRNAKNISSPSQGSDTINYAPVSAPAITAFSLDNGAGTTTDRIVTLDFTTTGNPDQYKVSESSDFAGASWNTITGTPTFELSWDNEVKTVYLKVRRLSDSAESSSANDTITLNLPAPAITAFAIDSGAGTTTDENVTLNFTTSGEADQYMWDEDEGFADGEWLTIGTAPTIQLSPGDGTKTIYLKVRRNSSTMDGQESAAATDQITLAIATPVINILSISDHGDQSIDLELSDSAGTAKTMKIIDVADGASAPDSEDWAAANSHVFATEYNHAAEGTGQRDVYIRAYNYNDEYGEDNDTVEVAAPASGDIDLSQYEWEGTPTKPSGWPSYVEGFCFVAGAESSFFLIDDAGTSPNYGLIKKFNIASNTIASDFSITLYGFTKPFSITHKTGNTYFILDKNPNPSYLFDIVEVEILPSTTGQTLTKSNCTITTVNPSAFSGATNNCDDLEYDPVNNRFIFPLSRYGKYPLVYNPATETVSKYAPSLADDWFINNIPLSASGNTDYFPAGLKYDTVSGHLLFVITSDNMANTNVFIAEFDGTQILSGKLVENTDFTESDKLIDVEITTDRSKIYLLSKINGIHVFTKTT